MSKWKPLTPYENPPGCAPGWYFVFKTRDGELASHGPFASKEICAKYIKNARPCAACKTLTFGDWGKFAPPPPGMVEAIMCADCETDFRHFAEQRGLVGPVEPTKLQ